MLYSEMPYYWLHPPFQLFIVIDTINISYRTQLWCYEQEQEISGLNTKLSFSRWRCKTVGDLSNTTQADNSFVTVGNLSTDHTERAFINLQVLLKLLSIVLARPTAIDLFFGTQPQYLYSVVESNIPYSDFIKKNTRIFSQPSHYSALKNYI